MKISNYSVLQHAGIEKFVTFISGNRLGWFGHVARMPQENPKNFCNGNHHMENGLGGDLASLGFIVSKRTKRPLQDPAPISAV